MISVLVARVRSKTLAILMMTEHLNRVSKAWLVSSQLRSRQVVASSRGCVLMMEIVHNKHENNFVLLIVNKLVSFTGHQIIVIFNDFVCNITLQKLNKK